MTDDSNAQPRRWAPEWIAVLTLAVAIVALGGGLFMALDAMEVRIREDMRELRRDVGTLRENTARIDERVLQLDGRVSRLEKRFDEEFPRRAAGVPSSTPGALAGRGADG